MLSDDVKSIVQTAYSQMLENCQLQGRSGQKHMIASIARTLARAANSENQDPSICVIEAGTGTGKTLSYLLSTLPLAAASEKKVVIATATVALQEQVMYKDIPDLQQHSSVRFTYALAKGRGRYLCLSRLDNALNQSNSSQQALRDLFQMQVEDSGQIDDMLYRQMLEELSSGKWSGDRDEWPEGIKDESWRPVAVEPGQCSGPRCSYFSNCCYFTSRNSLEKIDCVIANHDLVLSDLALGGGVVLPAPEDCIYIFDEAHQLCRKSLNHFSYSLRVRSISLWLDQFSVVLSSLAAEYAQSSRLPELLEGVREQAQHTQLMLQNLLLMLQDFSLDAEITNALGEQSQYVFEAGVVPADLCSVLDTASTEFASLATRVQRVEEHLQENINEEAGGVSSSEAEALYSLFGSARLRLEAAYSCCIHFSRKDESHEVPDARWLNFLGQGEVIICTSPVTAGPDLSENLWSTCYAAVLTSATLSSGGDFSYFSESAGLPESTVYESIESPFDFQGRATLRMPRFGFDPTDNNAHTQAVLEAITSILNNERGVLVLYSSRRQMFEVLEGLDSGLRRTVLCQDDYGKQELLRLHKEAIDKGASSCIFGLASMAEGIDLPGDYCSHVVIAKIPFPVPNDPVDQTLSKWIKARGRNPFQVLAIPEAALRLVQASGRLLRRETDSGRITILDQRLFQKPYGRQLLAALPPFHREYLN
jgi:ATP-dependent DNA helicase DinG